MPARKSTSMREADGAMTYSGCELVQHSQAWKKQQVIKGGPAALCVTDSSYPVVGVQHGENDLRRRHG